MTITTHTLTRDEYLNVIVDSMAQTFNQERVEGGEIYQADDLDRTKKCSIKWGNNDSNSPHITRSLLGKTLRQLINSQNTKGYVIYKRKIEPNDISHLDWDQLQNSIIGMTRNMQIWLSKWITGFMGTGKHLSLTGYHSQNECPRCLLPETNDHILRCQSISSTLLWNTELGLLCDDMQQRQGCPLLMIILRTYLENWYNQGQIPSLIGYERPYQLLIIEQSSLGRGNMFYGIFGKHWYTLQQAYLHQIRSLASPKRWMATLQRRIWMIAWKLWSDRNHCLHETDQGIEIQVINKILTEEYKSGLGTLPSQYAHLFRSTLATLSSHDRFIKQKWLASIWSARERHSDSQLYCDPESPHNSFFLRWRLPADPQCAIAERRALLRQT